MTSSRKTYGLSVLGLKAYGGILSAVDIRTALATCLSDSTYVFRVWSGAGGVCRHSPSLRDATESNGKILQAETPAGSSKVLPDRCTGFQPTSLPVRLMIVGGGTGSQDS